MMDIEWSTPPPETRGVYTRDGKTEHIEFANELRRNPGEWAILRRFPMEKNPRNARQNAYNFASRINKGKAASFGTGFEAVARLIEDEKVTAVFVRFIDDGQCTASSWKGHGHQPFGPGGFNRCIRQGDQHHTHQDDFGNRW